MHKPKYPRLPVSLDRRIKLTPTDIKQIKQMYRKGVPVKKIAYAFEVSNQLIYIRINKKTEKRHNEYARKRSKLQYEQDKDNCLRVRAENLKYLREVNGQKIRKYQRKYYKYRKQLTE